MRNYVVGTIVTCLLATGLGVQNRVGVPRAEARYTITDLGEFLPNAINEAGDVVGSRKTDKLDPKSRVPIRAACIWQNGTFRDLGAFGGSGGDALGINDRNQVIGWAHTAEGDEHPFLWEEGKLKDLGTLGGLNGRAYAINNVGEIVGASDNRDGFEHAFLLQRGHLADLGAVRGFPDSEARCLNRKGVIAGVAYGPDAGQVAFIYHADTMRGLGALPDNTSGSGSGGGFPPGIGGFQGQRVLTAEALGINENGDIVGSSQNHAVQWHAGAGPEELAASRPDEGSAAYGVDDQDHIVGYSGNHATLWDNLRPVDLNTRVPSGSGWTLMNARAINNHGQVIGIGTVKERMHGFRLDPIR